MLDVLPENSIPDGGGQLRRAAVENIDRLLDGGNLSHVAPFLQSCLHDMRKLDCAQAAQNPLPMRSIGKQARDFRLGKEWSTAEMAKAIGGKVKRQHIEQLEKAGNRRPHYLGDLARVLGVTVDQMMVEAGLMAELPKLPPAPPAGPLADRLREEREQDPYELIERGLKALVVVGRAKEKILDAVREAADVAAETQRELDERFRSKETK
jgi:transcriptional regulator with XRE-family HTH domain